jgi:hypothetical protein
MIDEPSIYSVAHSIQLAVAPVFLLSGIGAMLAVMTTRLARAIDRARVVEDLVAGDPRAAGEHRAEIELLSGRARLIGWSVGLCTFSALLVAGVIAVLFLGAFLTFDPRVPVAALFVAAMVSLIAALLLFLREIYLATASLRLGRR